MRGYGKQPRADRNGEANRGESRDPQRGSPRAKTSQRHRRGDERERSRKHQRRAYADQRVYGFQAQRISERPDGRLMRRGNGDAEDADERHYQESRGSLEECAASKPVQRL